MLFTYIYNISIKIKLENVKKNCFNLKNSYQIIILFIKTIKIIFKYFFFILINL